VHHEITNPQFDRKPNSDDMAQYYPERAQRLEKTGTASIHCSVNARGGLVNCSIVSENPEGYGFGDAAIKMSHIFKLKPATSDGVPVDGGTITIPLRFTLAE
jgi:protein TonB